MGAAKVPVSKEGLEESLKDLKLSSDEINKFDKAFKDPEFLKMFEEYAKEVSDPKVKAETDLYLRQLENEGRAEDTYGKGVQLIAPNEAFVIKTREAGGKSAANSSAKVYINICTSEKLEPCRRKEGTNVDGQKGTMLEIPLSLGARKAGSTRSGATCAVWDFVVHPETIAQAMLSQGIMRILADTAMETIEKSALLKLDRKYKSPKNLKYKATEGCDRPQVLTVRVAADGSSAKPGQLLRPATATGALNDAVAMDGGATAAAAAGATAVGAGSVQGESGGKGARSGFSFGKAKATTAALATPTDPSQAGFVHPSGEVTPVWELVHRGAADLSEAWGDAGRNMAINTRTPKELVARFSLPDITSAAAVDLDVGRVQVSLKVEGKYAVVVPLPYPVDDARGRAKFDKAKRQLEVVLPVLQPKPATSRPMGSPLVQEVGQEQLQAVEEQPQARGLQGTAQAESSSDVQAQGSELLADCVPAAAVVEQPAQTSSLHDGEGAGLHALLAHERPHGTGASGSGTSHAAEAEALTENQRRWQELHLLQQQQQEAVEAEQQLLIAKTLQAHPAQDLCGQADVSNASHSTLSSGAADKLACAVSAAAADAGAEAAALAAAGIAGPRGMSTDASAVLAQTLPLLPPPVVLKPRLNQALAAELD